MKDKFERDYGDLTPARVRRDAELRQARINKAQRRARLELAYGLYPRDNNDEIFDARVELERTWTNVVYSLNQCYNLPSYEG